MAYRYACTRAIAGTHGIVQSFQDRAVVQGERDSVADVVLLCSTPEFGMEHERCAAALPR